MPQSKITFHFSRATSEEAREQATQGFEQIRRETSLRKAESLIASERKKEHEKVLNRNRVREFRKRKIEQEIVMGDRDIAGRPVKRMRLHNKTSPTPNPPVESKLKEAIEHSPSPPCSPSKGHVIPQPKQSARTSRTNWFQTGYWSAIDRVVKNHRFWNLQAVVKELRRGANGPQFNSLHPGTLTKWIDHENLCWNCETMEKVNRTKKKEPKDAPHLIGSKKPGRQRVFDRYPEILEDVKTYLKKLRLSGAPIAHGVAHATIIGFFKSCAPEAFNGGLFKCSDRFVQRFMETELKWSYRSATQAAQHVPNDWEQSCTDMAMRLAWLIKQYNVPCPLVLNGDQTGIVYISTGSRTWAETGSKQVQVTGKDEKRQFTLMPTVAASGVALPFQMIYAGKSDKSLPSAHFRRACESEGFLFTLGGMKHWSNLTCMMEYIEKIIVPYIDRVVNFLNLPPTQKAILLLDCWAVHRSKEFTTWMRQTHPRIKIVYIPGGCTSKAQPCDINFQRPLKHVIKTECIKHLVERTQVQLDQNISPEKVRVDFSVGTLRNQSPGWLLAAYQWFQNHPEAIYDAWSRAKFGEWNLSYDFLVSPYARSVVDERFDNDPAFALSVAQNATATELREHLETNTDGIDYEDDPTLSPLDISNLGAGSDPSQRNATIYNNNYIYNGEDDILDNEQYDGDELETNIDGDSDDSEAVGPYLYRQPGAISSSSSLASMPPSASESEFNASEPSYSYEGHNFNSQNSITSPETLIGPRFTIVDSD